MTESAVKVNPATKQRIEFLSKVFDVSQAEIVSLAVKEYVSEETPQEGEFMHLRNLPLTRYEKKILRRLLCDIELHEKIMGDTDLPLVEQLRVAGDQVKLVLESGNWLLEAE